MSRLADMCGTVTERTRCSRAPVSPVMSLNCKALARTRQRGMRVAFEVADLMKLLSPRSRFLASRWALVILALEGTVAALPAQQSEAPAIPAAAAAAASEVTS